MAPRRPPRTRRGRGRGRTGQRSQESPGMARLIRHPVDVPAIREQLVSQRWVRIKLIAATAGLHQVFVSDVEANMFSGASGGRGAFYVHRVRIYGPQLTADSAGTVLPKMSVPSVSVNIPLRPGVQKTDFPFQRFLDKGMQGSARSCVAVEMPKYWQDYPLGATDGAVILFEITNLTANVDYVVDLFCTISYAPENATFTVVK